MGLTLHVEIASPRAAAKDITVAILLHGRGSDEADLAGLGPALPDDWALILPRAPFPGSAWGYGGGWAWYRYLGGTRPDPDSYARSLAAVAGLLDDVPQILGRSPARVLLGGFSQGGTVSLGYALAANAGRVPAGNAERDAPRVRYLASLSGFLPDHPRVQVAPATVAGTRFFWAHGRRDPATPFPVAADGRAALLAAGADLVINDFDGGHWIDPASISAMVDWMRDASHDVG
jgi:phospholipase/carboxylesterase